MPLTNLQIQRLQPKPKDYWLSDEKGLRLLIKPNGSRYWRMKYRFAGKQKTLALGVYPDVSLKDARLARDKARLQLAEGVDPHQEKLNDKREQLIEGGIAFSSVAKDWWEHQRGLWQEKHANRVWNRLEANCFSELDKKPINKIHPQDIIAIIRKIEDRNALDVASRALQDLRRVFRYAVQMGILVHNPASELSGIVKTWQVQHRASLNNKELGQFLFELKNYHTQGKLLTQLALEMLVYTFSRSGEIRNASWKEFDFEDKLWRIPAERMKMRTEHLVPLVPQTLHILKQLKPITGQYKLVFP